MKTIVCYVLVVLATLLQSRCDDSTPVVIMRDTTEVSYDTTSYDGLIAASFVSLASMTNVYRSIEDLPASDRDKIYVARVYDQLFRDYLQRFVRASRGLLDKTEVYSSGCRTPSMRWIAFRITEEWKVISGPIGNQTTRLEYRRIIRSGATYLYLVAQAKDEFHDCDRPQKHKQVHP